LFVIVNSGLLLVTEALQFILIDLVRIEEIFGVGSGLVFYTLIGFFLNKNIVYRITHHSS